ncbi:YfiR family protein [Thermogutta sp.]|jgi:hypothetical protein|uniref:YfiR family protein n=1 Tax=Thermogutta sp. TaxID=1962930 RepID=UPI0032209731
MDRSNVRHDELPITFKRGADPLNALVSAAALILLLVSRPSYSQEVINREYLIKAAFLINFVRYIEWPDPAEAPSQPVIIGVYKPDSISPYLRQAIETDAVPRPIQLRILNPDDPVPRCHILYFPRAVPPETQRNILQTIPVKGVLLVGETEGFLEWGGTINFVIVENKVRLEINASQAQAQGLKISSKLIQIARAVR